MLGDLFRAGHVSLLREARRHGDRLIGGALSDAAAASPTPRMGIASSCMTAPPRLKIAYDKDTKGEEGRSHPRFPVPASAGYGTGAERTSENMIEAKFAESSFHALG
jgi:hypothetical protein